METAAQKKDWAVVVQYECGLGEPRHVVSRHYSYDLACKAARRLGFYSFVRIAGPGEWESNV